MTAFHRLLDQAEAADRVSSRPMHVLIATLYAVVIWLAVLAWSVIARGPWGVVLACGPFLVSGCIVVVLLLDAVVAAVRGFWRGRATLRLWR